MNFSFYIWDCKLASVHIQSYSFIFSFNPQQLQTLKQCHSDLVMDLRNRLEDLNNYVVSDSEWTEEEIESKSSSSSSSNYQVLCKHSKLKGFSVMSFSRLGIGKA